MELKGQILLYTETGCKDCMSAKTKLESLLLPYVEVDLVTYPDRRYEMENLTDQSTVPQIFLNDHHIGGYYDLIELESNGQLEDLISKVKKEPTPLTAPQPPQPSDIGDYSIDNSRRMQLEEVIIKMGNDGVISDIRVFLTVHHNAFYGKDVVAWLTAKQMMPYQEALSTGADLVLEGYIVHVSDPKHPFSDSSQLFKLVGTGHPSALNAGLAQSFGADTSAIKIGENLRKYITSLYGKHLTEDGSRVNYENMKTDVEFAKYVMTAQKLQRVCVQDLSRQEKVAMFINVYNALMIHGIISRGAPANHWQRYQFFGKVSYIIGGQNYSLNEIENGVLRGNRKGMVDIFRPFSNKDARLSVALKKPEPRIHFALNCGSKGCPPIRVYVAENIETQLNRASRGFLLSGGCTVDSNTHSVTLSPILKWYREDFGDSIPEMLQWVSNHMSNTDDGRVLQEMIDAKIYKLSWQDYDWSLNH